MGKYIYTKPSKDLIKGNFNQATLDHRFWQSPSSVALGYNDDGSVLLELTSAPHTLIAGCSGSGKSVLMHSIITSLLLKNTPNTARLILIDPKRIEFSFYKNHPMLLTPVINEPQEARQTLDKVLDIIKDRQITMENNQERFWNGYKIYIFIDELGDLILSEGGRKVEKTLARIAMVGRACGVHLIMATQHPKADILTPQIKNNCDTRIALKTVSSSASKVVLEMEVGDMLETVGIKGSNKLNGKGDAIIRTSYGDIKRFQGYYLSDDEIKAISQGYSITDTVEQTITVKPKFKFITL